MQPMGTPTGMSLSSWSSWCLWPYIVYNIICLNCFISYDENLKSDEVFSFPREIVVVPILTLVVDDGHFLLFRLRLLFFCYWHENRFLFCSPSRLSDWLWNFFVAFWKNLHTEWGTSTRNARIRRHRQRFRGLDFDIFSRLYESRFGHDAFLIIGGTSSASEQPSPAENAGLGEIVVEYLVLEVVVGAELLGHLEEGGVGEFAFAEVNPLDVPLELDRPVDLDFLVGADHARDYFVALAAVEGRPQFLVRQLVQDVVAELESPDGRRRAAGVHVGDRAPVPDVALEEEVGLAVAGAASDSMGVVGEVDGAVLDPFEGRGGAVLPVEHPVLPVGPGALAEGPRGHPGFELVPVVGVLHEELHVGVDVHVDDDRRVVHDVVVQVLQVALLQPQALDPGHQGFLVDPVQLL